MMTLDSSSTIRKVEISDVQILIRLFEENNRPEITDYFHPFPLNQQMAEYIACTSNLDHYYLAIWNGRAAGFCMLRGWDDGYQVPSFGVFVDYRYQGHGLGRQMTTFAILEAQKLSSSQIRLSVYAGNERALPLYQSLGFQEVSRELTLMAGRQSEKIVMVKSL